MSPEEVIELAQKNECSGISWTYNEPTLWFEYTLDIAKLSKAVGLYTNYVTNGFMTPEALDLIGPYLDIFRVDLKAFCKESYNKIAHISEWEGILQNIKRAHKKWKMHIEIVTNIIPGYNANPDQFRAMAKWIKNELGKNTPWHITRFVPNWQLEDVPSTPVNCLEKIINLIKEEGLNNIYIGNVIDHRCKNTYCPSCSALVIERDHYGSINNYLKNSRCPECGEKISGHFVNSQ
jgi:pyruvate formate lyase activating enzyme